MAHLPFADRVDAGRLLAKELPAEGVVVGLARGGVPVGFVVASRLHLPFDVMVARKLGVPWQPELAMGAIAGTAQVLDAIIIRELGISGDELEDVVQREQAEMARREELYRGGRPALNLEGQAVFLVDDGLATGATMIAAVRNARNLNAARTLVAVPVGSREACKQLCKEADAVVCLATPEPFQAVGEWYRDFAQVSDSEVCKLLSETRLQEVRPQ